MIQKMDDVMKDDDFFRHKAVKVHKLRNFKLTTNVTNVSHVIANSRKRKKGSFLNRVSEEFKEMRNRDVNDKEAET